MSGTSSNWWRGARGEWFVVAQVTLMLLVFFGPRSSAGWPGAPFPFPRSCSFVGAGMLVIGGLVLVAGILRLGPGLSPLPYPKDGAALIETGIYGLARHPMYGGGILLAFGWSLFVQGWFTLGYSVVLFAVLDFKSRQEEKWLKEKFPGYDEYQRRVRRFFPFIY